jgi:hypothetical protein
MCRIALLYKAAHQADILILNIHDALALGLHQTPQAVRKPRSISPGQPASSSYLAHIWHAWKAKDVLNVKKCLLL